MGKLQSLGLCLWILGLTGTIVDVICNVFKGTSFNTNSYFTIFWIGLIIFTLGASNKKN